MVQVTEVIVVGIIDYEKGDRTQRAWEDVEVVEMVSGMTESFERPCG